MNILLVGFDENVSAELAKLIPGFINCHFLERKDFPEEIRPLEFDLAVFDLTVKIKSDGFKIRSFVNVIERENNQKNPPIPVQIYLVSDPSGEADLRFMLSDLKTIDRSYLRSKTIDELDLLRSIMEKFYEFYEPFGTTAIDEFFNG